MAIGSAYRNGGWPCRALVCVLLVGCAAQAGAVDFRLGAQVTGSRTSLAGDLPGEGSWEGKFTPGIGLTAELGLSEVVGIGLQPSLIQRGANQVFRNDGQEYLRIDYSLDYFSLPVVVRVTGDPVGTRGYVTAGLDFSFLIDATLEDGSTTSDISDGMESTTIGALMGAGVMVPVGRHFLAFELRYSQGLQDLAVREDDGSSSTYASPSVKYRGVDLLVAFMFTLGGE